MAELNLNELQAATDYYIEQEQPIDIFFRSNVLIYKLMSENKTFPGGQKIQVNLEYDMTHAGAYGPTSEMPISKKEILNAAFFDYAAYYSTLTLDMEDDLLNAGEPEIVDLLRAKLQNAEKSIRKAMAEDIYKDSATALSESGDPNAKPFTGLGDLFNDSASFAYGEITPNQMSEWTPNKVTSQYEMGFTFMQMLRREASVDNGNEGKPDLYVTTQKLQDAFEATLQIQARYADENLLNVGFNNILFHGAPIVDDDKCDAGYIYGLNTGFLDILTHSKRNFTRPEWKSPIQQPDTATANIRWAGNLVCRNRKAHVLANDVVEPA